jgi:hypothetical protein
MLLNQWANVVRWELRPRLFLRTTEFLWQEGHTCHASEDDARAYALRILHEVYEDFMVNVLGLPVLTGLKSERERFAGADNSWTCEGMMGDGKALQMGTSHLLGQNFAKVFDTQFLTETGEREYAWQTSWGVSTRLVGALIMGHGDDAGLRVPPALAPIQVVVLVVRDEGGAGEKAAALAEQLRSAVGQSSGSSRACPSAFSWAGATSPEVRPTWCGAIAPTRSPRPSTVCRCASPPSSTRSRPRSRRAPRNGSRPARLTLRRSKRLSRRPAPDSPA